MSQHDRHMQRLARGALSSHLLLFRWWLMYSGGELRDGQWRPLPDLHRKRCGELLRSLHTSQLDDLCWRGIIPHPQERRLPEFFLRVSQHPCFHEQSDRVTIITDPLFDQVLYDLSGEDSALIRLRYGDMELLEAADFPETLPGLIAALWPRIAPTVFKSPPRSAPALLSDLSAVLHANPPDASTFARLRELLPPPQVGHKRRDRIIAAEREVIQAASHLVFLGSAGPLVSAQAFNALSQAVQALEDLELGEA
jgi:hypothetical protein